jgi:hypothetical protein
VLEGDNQKQADFHSRSLVQADPKKLHDLHLIISSVSRPEHVTLFELGIAKKRDFAFAGPQSLRVAQLLEDGVLEIGAIHTYVGLYSRLLVDLAPNAVLVCAEQADRINSIPFISIRCISLFTKRTVKRRKGQSGWTRERHAGRFCRSDKEFYRPDYQWVDCLSLPPTETRRQGHDCEESLSMMRFTYRLSDKFMEYGGCS